MTKKITIDTTEITAICNTRVMFPEHLGDVTVDDVEFRGDHCLRMTFAADTIDRAVFVKVRDIVRTHRGRVLNGSTATSLCIIAHSLVSIDGPLTPTAFVVARPDGSPMVAGRL
jgi:hypothetical protein